MRLILAPSVAMGMLVSENYNIPYFLIYSCYILYTLIYIGYYGAFHIIRKDVENLLNIGQTQASTYIKALIDKAIISKTGSGKGVIYVLA